MLMNQYYQDQKERYEEMRFLGWMFAGSMGSRAKSPKALITFPWEKPQEEPAPPPPDISSMVESMSKTLARKKEGKLKEFNVNLIEDGKI